MYCLHSVVNINNMIASLLKKDSYHKSFLISNPRTSKSLQGLTLALSKGRYLPSETYYNMNLITKKNSCNTYLIKDKRFHKFLKTMMTDTGCACWQLLSSTMTKLTRGWKAWSLFTERTFPSTSRRSKSFCNQDFFT